MWRSPTTGTEQPASGSQLGPCSFVVDIDDPDLGPATGPVYAVTARHVIEKIATDGSGRAYLATTQHFGWRI